MKPPVISPHQKRTMEAAFAFKDMINGRSKEEDEEVKASEEASEENDGESVQEEAEDEDD